MFTVAIRLMTKTDPMEMEDDFFELVIQGSDYLEVFELMCLESMEQLLVTST